LEALIQHKENAMNPYVDADSLSAKTAEWLTQIEPYNQHKLTLKPDKSALLVIDMQKFFLDPKSPSFTCGGLAILPTLRRLIAAFREHERPVIYTRHVHHPGGLDGGITGWWWEGMCLEGSPDSEIHDDLTQRPSDKVVLKHRYSAFYNTDLETVLRCLGIEDLVVTGVMTNMCCESTARDAYFRDYRVFFLADGTGSINEEMQLASLVNLAFGFAYVTSADRIIRELAA
jgi:nicotinamidase-related amidase